MQLPIHHQRRRHQGLPGIHRFPARECRIRSRWFVQLCFGWWLQQHLPHPRLPGGSRCHVRLLTHDNKPLTDAEGRYFKDHNPPYPYYEGAENLGKNGGLYNRLGRGYPDVAANGDNIAVFNGGEFGSSGGTSASMLTLHTPFLMDMQVCSY